MPKYSLEKNNTNPDFVSGFVLFSNGGEKEIRTLVGVLALTRFPVVRLRPAQPSLRAADLTILADYSTLVKRKCEIF